MTLRNLPWKQFSADPRAEHHRYLRASDQDRNLVLDVLGAAFADGKLNRAEFEDRTQSALTAATLGQCLSLLADLAPIRKQRDTLARPRARSNIHRGPVMAPLGYSQVAVGAGVAPVVTYAVVRAFGGMSGGWQPPTLFWIVTAILLAHAALTLAGHKVHAKITSRRSAHLPLPNT